MPVSREFRDATLNLLEMIAPVEARAMFGGVGLYCRGIFFGLMANDVLYFKTDATSRLPYLAAGSRQFGRHYFEVPPAVIDDADELETWLARALRAAGPDVAP